MEDLGAKQNTTSNELQFTMPKRTVWPRHNHIAGSLHRIATLETLDGLVKDRLGEFLCDELATSLKTNLMASM